MGYLIAVDTSLSMARAPDGGAKAMINGLIEKSRFELAADIVEALLQFADRLNVEPVVHLFRIGETYLNLGEVSSIEDVVKMITKDEGKDVELYGCANMSRFMAFSHDRLNPTMEDKMIILTDCATFLGDVNYGVGCETRFIIVNSNKASMSPLQLEELDEIAASSVGYEPSPDNEPLYHHFFLGDFPSIHELSSSVFEEMFEMSTYTLQMGHLTTQMKIGHSFYQRGVERISILGFLRPTALMNMEATGTHFCHPVFYEEPVAPTETTASEGDIVDEYDGGSSSSFTDSDETDQEYTETEVEVTDNDEEEGEVKEDKPRMNFIPQKAMSTTIDLAALFAATTSSSALVTLPDFVPPTSTSAPAAPTAPKRKYKVISRSSGVEKEYVAGAVIPIAGSAVDTPSPAFEPLEEPKPVEKKKNQPPPPKKTKKVKRMVAKKKDKKKESVYERAQRRRAARARAELLRLQEIAFHRGPPTEESPKKEEPVREEYDRDDVVLTIVAKSDGEESEDCWSVKEGEYSDTETQKKIKEEFKEEDEKKKKEEEEKKKVEEKQNIAEEKMDTADKVEGEKKVETTDVEMKEDKGEEKKEEDTDNEGVVDVIPTPFQQPSRRRRRRRRGVIDPDFTAPYLVQMLTESMRLEEMFAVAIMDNGEYAVLSVDQNSDGDDLLAISTVVDQDMMPTVIPHFEQLTTIFDDTNEVDNVYLSQPIGENPSYIVARTAWFDEDGLEADMVRIRKNLKKIPERISHFYGDINRMRTHAYCVCMQEHLGKLADMIVAEAKDIGELAVKHAEYVAGHFRKIVNSHDLKDIPMPKF